MIVAVYTVAGNRLTSGVNVAVSLIPAYVTAPVTGVTPGPAIVNVLTEIVAAFIALLKVAVTA